MSTASDTLDTNCFNVTENEKKFVRRLWDSCNERNLTSVALRDENTHNFLTFDNLAMINSNPKPPVLKRLKRIYQNYQIGWLSEIVVDYYLSQLCKLANKDTKQNKFGVMQCTQTAMIINKQTTPNIFLSVSKSCYFNGKFCEVMFFPLLENRHFTLYVIDNIKENFMCYDSLSRNRDTRQKMANHGQAFLDFFRNGRVNRHWGEMPCVLDAKQTVSVKQASCCQQGDSSSCGIFCCLFGEEICLAKKRIRPIDNSDTLRIYITLQMIKRSRIIDPVLQKLVLAFNSH